MKQITVGILSGLLLFSLAGITGCGSNEKAKIPDKTIDLPKEGPKAAGAPAGNPDNPKGKSKGDAAQ